jgi:predicted RNase H-like nuclease (RuvC/YqgF family)
MSSMNLLKMKREIENLNSVVNNLKEENSSLKSKLYELNDNIIDVNIKKPSCIEVTNFIDEVKDEITILASKIDEINKKRFLKDIATIDKHNEAYLFLKELEINDKIINILIFLNYNTIKDLCQINIEDLDVYNIERELLEIIIKRACEKVIDSF